MRKLIQAIKHIIIAYKCRKRNVKLAPDAQVDIVSELEGCNRIGTGSFFSGKLGYGSYMGENCRITANIGRFCSIASRVVTVRGRHPIKDWVSTHPAFYSAQRQCGMTFVAEERFLEISPPITIGNDVWIGDSAILMDGITIGDGAVIGTGAVVTRDVEPYSVVVGVPAREIKKRFSQETVEKLTQLQWWNRSGQWLREHVDKFCDVNMLLKDIE